ncbi:DNA polymerase IV [Alkaliphilus transvaalensis]|uniref:DNA polymerase IV n=1 Tax=Alkaliphilus transvaalensis TaxID=114628 RepID=UPI000479C1B2|nr:DNA polymerase IV [Alkaliphilus transvaalensis]
MKKVIFLVDMNAFFISCEMTRYSHLIGKPAAVAGDPKKRTGIILAANYEARNFGVKTAMVLHRALELCPDLLLVPPDHQFYQKKSNEVMEILSNYTPVVEKNSIDEAWLDMTGTEGLFGPPTKAAEKIMNDLKDQLGLWCSVGISENKFLSKMASEFKKPLGITELWRKDMKKKMWPLPINMMYGVGEKTATRLNRMGIKTIGDLALFDRNYLIKNLGKSGLDLYEKANGIDPSPIVANSPEEIKSIGRSTTLSEDTSDLETLKDILMELSEDVGITARKHQKKGRTVQITLKFSDFQVITRQTPVAPTCFTKEIYRAGYQLLKSNLKDAKKVRLIGITLGGFDDYDQLEQLSFFDTTKNTKHEKIDEVMDKIRGKYGFKKINRASLLKDRLKDRE